MAWPLGDAPEGQHYALSQEERRTVSWLGSASPFNITAEATSLGPFTEPEVVELLGQHTAVTGQRFEPEAAAEIYELSQGHPWLVNALADQIVDRDLRALTYLRPLQIPAETATFVRGDGSLDMAKLMAAWQVFWRKDGHLAAEGFGYREAGPHLMLMAFLQRVVNGGGRVEREYGLGRGAVDIVIEWRGARHAIEVKLRRDTETEREAVEQVCRYLDHAGLSEGWLVMFDLRSKLPWEERLWTRQIEADGKRVVLVGC